MYVEHNELEAMQIVLYTLSPLIPMAALCEEDAVSFILQMRKLRLAEVKY